jgi:glycosyltransferase involved in cell wall biosynthesis
VARVALFEWSAGGHRPVYVRRFVEALRGSADILLALPQPTLDAVADLDVATHSLGDPRPAFGGRLHPSRRSVLAAEVERLREVVPLADQTVHLYADHALLQLARAAPLPRPVSLVLYYPRGHYAKTYGTRLPASDRGIALAKEWALRRWRRRPDAHTVFTLDEEAARLWESQPGAPAHWLPEPPVLTPPPLERPSQRRGCILYGSLGPRKGIHLLARALTIEPTPLRLVVAGTVGRDYSLELERLAEAMRASGVDVDLRVRNHSEIEGLRALAAAYCALLPYPYHSGMSRVLVEACSVGTPVVADRFGLLGHLVRRHELGLAVDCANPRVLREAVLSLTDPERAHSYSEQLDRFAARFSPEQFRDALVSGLRITTRAIA